MAPSKGLDKSQGNTQSAAKELQPQALACAIKVGRATRALNEYGAQCALNKLHIRQ